VVDLTWTGLNGVSFGESGGGSDDAMTRIRPLWASCDWWKRAPEKFRDYNIVMTFHHDRC
jgi:hypothetical protein